MSWDHASASMGGDEATSTDLPEPVTLHRTVWGLPILLPLLAGAY
jgi:hypothetical protein